MKSTIKTILTSAMAAIATFFMVVYISCSKDKCSSTVCYNGGTCSGGNCTCTSGFEGSDCKTASSTKFIGNWGVSNSTASTSEPAAFAVSVSQGTGISGLLIHNLHNLFTAPVSATVSMNSITIPSQQVQGKVVVGAGYIYSSSVYAINNTISISYTVTDVLTHVTDSETELWNG